MESIAPAFGRGERDRAGDILRSKDPPPGEREEATRIWNNWRASHAVPLDDLERVLRKKAESVDRSALVYGRLKRLPSVVKKLQIRSTMRLSQIQDVAGCRAVVKSLQDVYAVRALYAPGDPRHQLKGQDDYIAKPKPSGYRSVHMVHRFAPPPEPYAGLFVETQIRSQLQHAWATAVETVDILHAQTLKIGGGTDDWKRFFLLASSAFALREGSAVAPGTPADLPSIVKELQELETALQAESKLTAYKDAIRATSENVRDAKYLLLQLTPAEGILEIKGFREDEFEDAMRLYTAVDRARAYPGTEAVIVAVDSVQELRQAYPNWYLDTELFVETYRGLMEG